MRRTRRAERPGAFRASPSLHSRGFDPHHLSHKSFPGLVLSSLLQRISLHDESQLILPGTNRKGVGAARRLGPTRIGTGFLNNRLPFAIVFGRLVCSRRAFSATSIGTCSKCVFPFCIGVPSCSCVHRSSPQVIRGKSLICLRLDGAPHLRGI